MAGRASEPPKDWQALAGDSWRAWFGQLSQAAESGAGPSAPADDPLARGMEGLKSYLDWMQGVASGLAAAAAGGEAKAAPFAGPAAPFAQAFAGAVPPGAPPSWQAVWLAAMKGGMADLPGVTPVAAFGSTREQQLQQQALAAAMAEYLETSSRYQELIQRANAEGAARLQARLEKLADAGQAVESLKALYDLWVEVAEEAYAEAALSHEFRESYGAMANAQMRVRKLQQQWTEQWCRELGMPTRSEVASLGRRLQEVRRELRARPQEAGRDDALAALKADVAALKRQLDALGQVPGEQAAAAAAPAAGKTADRRVQVSSRRAKATTTDTGGRSRSSSSTPRKRS